MRNSHITVTQQSNTYKNQYLIFCWVGGCFKFRKTLSSLKKFEVFFFPHLPPNIWWPPPWKFFLVPPLSASTPYSRPSPPFYNFVSAFFYLTKKLKKCILLVSIKPIAGIDFINIKPGYVINHNGIVKRFPLIMGLRYHCFLFDSLCFMSLFNNGIFRRLIIIYN